MTSRFIREALGALVLVMPFGMLGCQCAGPTVEKSEVAKLGFAADTVVLGKPFQPDDRTKSQIGKPVVSDEPGVQKVNSFIVKEGVPYFPYRYLKNSDSYAFHPLLLGNYIGKADKSAVTAALKMSSPLPNGGRAWYYPPLYRNSRMQGPFWRYSGMSQGAIIAGFVRQALSGNEVALAHAKDAVLGLRFPFELGGVNLDDRAILEMPSYLAAPEIILNGWLDALFHIHAYATVASDSSAKDLLSKNLQYLVGILPRFDLPEERLSRYSDLSPYRATLLHEDPEVTAAIKALYVPMDDRAKSLVVPLRKLKQDSVSIYDNQILSRKAGLSRITVSISGSYETTIWSDKPFTLRIETGVSSLTSSTPGRGGTIHEIASRPGLGGEVAVLESKKLGLIPGYPTNFSRSGKYNFYHVYHVIALMLLGRYVADDPVIRTQLLEYASKWRNYMKEKHTEEPLEFYDLDAMLLHIQKSRVLSEPVAYTELEEWVERELQAR